MTMPPPPPAPNGPPAAPLPWFRSTWAIVGMVALAFLAGISAGGGSPEPDAAPAGTEAVTSDTSAPVEQDDGPDFSDEAAAICDEVTNSAELADAIRNSGVPTSQQRDLRQAVEAACPSAASAAPPPAETAFSDPQPGDYELEVVTLEEQCFGSAGCNVRFRVELVIVRPQNVDPAKTYELTYRVMGGDDPLMRTMEITGDRYSSRGEELIGTPAAGTELTTEVVRLAARP